MLLHLCIYIYAKYGKLIYNINHMTRLNMMPIFLMNMDLV